MSRQELLQQLIENFQGIYRGIRQRSDQQIGGIPYGQKAALFTIAMHKTVNIKQLADSLHITSGAATQFVEALVKEELVKRITDPADRRNVIIELSTKGKALIKRMEQQRIAMLQELFSDISDDELIAYNDVMQKVNNKIA